MSAARTDVSLSRLDDFPAAGLAEAGQGRRSLDHGQFVVSVPYDLMKAVGVPDEDRNVGMSQPGVTHRHGLYVIIGY